MAESSFLQGDHNNAVVVPFSDDERAAEKSDDDETDAPTDTAEQKADRQKRRNERQNRLISEGKQNKEKAERLEAELAAANTRLSRLEGTVAAQQRPQQPGVDPYEQRLNAVYDRQSEAYNTAQAEIKAGTFTPERQKYYEQVAREIESDKTRIHTERAIDQRAPALRAEQAQQVWVQKYPEVYNNSNAFTYAQAKFQQRRALGENPTNEMVDEIMTETLTTFKLGKRAPASANERSRMSGLPSAGAGGAARGTGVDMRDPKLRRMAIAAYSDLPEEEAIKKWVNKTGKRLRDRKVL